MSQRFVLIGHPVAHSISPAIHRAAYANVGLAAEYELVDAPDEAAVRAAVQAVRDGRFVGANVTVPWKQTALSLADEQHESAAAVGAANVLVRDAAGRVVAHNTDVAALAAELAALAPAEGDALVLGAGGAALAAVAAARLLGASAIGVSARRFDAALVPAAWPNATVLVRLGAELLSWGDGVGALGAFASHASVLIQATSAGMHGAGAGEDVARIVPWERLRRGVRVYDLVYNPAQTPFLSRARAAGLTASGGLGMLVGQAALAFELWFGRPAPRAAMQEAAVQALAARAV